MSATAQTHSDRWIARLRLQRVLHDFGETLAVTAIDDHSFRVSTPFSFANGDTLPIVVETRGTGWRITDRGATIANLTQGHFELADPDIDLIETIADATGSWSQPRITSAPTSTTCHHHAISQTSFSSKLLSAPSGTRSPISSAITASAVDRAKA
jgi:hypothetical protein